MLNVQLLVNVTMYKITQLVPSTEYRIQVACINVNGTGPFSDYIEVLSGDNSKFIYYVYHSDNYHIYHVRDFMS